MTNPTFQDRLTTLVLKTMRQRDQRPAQQARDNGRVLDDPELGTTGARFANPATVAPSSEALSARASAFAGLDAPSGGASR